MCSIESRLNLFQAWGFGMIGKIYVTFNETWWPNKDNFGIDFLFESPSNYTDAEMAEDWTRGIGGATPVVFA